MHPLPQDGCTPIFGAAREGKAEAVKELISAGCDINLASKVKQMTGLVLALALRPFPALLPLPPLAHLNLQYLLRLLLESLTYQLWLALLLCNSNISLENA